jgi:hypothetical protein
LARLAAWPAGRAVDKSPARSRVASGELDTIGDVIPLATVISRLDRHQGAATVFLTAGLIVGTAYYAVQNRRMVREMKRARELAIKQREIEEHREQLRELRLLTDDAACALNDMASVLGTFLHVIPHRDPLVSRRSPIEARDPDPQEFIEVCNDCGAPTCA